MHKDYLHFSEKDFITDEYFHQWVKFPNAENKAFWNKLMADHPGKKEHMERAKAFIENLSFVSEFPSRHEVEASLKQSLQKIAVLETQGNIKTIRKRRNSSFSIRFNIPSCCFLNHHFVWKIPAPLSHRHDKPGIAQDVLKPVNKLE